jgi:hypothetical protein
MLTSGVGLVAATAALWVQGWRRADHRFFAGLISIAVTLSSFSVVAWAAAAIAPLPLTWALVGTLALLFGLRLYRQLLEPPPGEHSPEPCLIGLASTHLVQGVRDRLQPVVDVDVGDDPEPLSVRPSASWKGAAPRPKGSIWADPVPSLAICGVSLSGVMSEIENTGRSEMRDP